MEHGIVVAGEERQRIEQQCGTAADGIDESQPLFGKEGGLLGEVCTPNFQTSRAVVLSPLTAAKTTLAFNAAFNFRHSLLIALDLPIRLVWGPNHGPIGLSSSWGPPHLDPPDASSGLATSPCTYGCFAANSSPSSRR